MFRSSNIRLLRQGKFSIKILKLREGKMALAK